VFAETSTIQQPADRHAADAGAANLCMKRQLVVSHQSALTLHRVHQLDHTHSIHMTSDIGTAARYDGLDVSAAALPGEHLHRERIAGLEVTSIARSVVDTARTVPFLDGVVAADHALRHKPVGKKALRAVLSRCANWPGALAAARVIDFADKRSESVLESASRVFFEEEDIEMPVPQVWMDVPGFGRVRLDFYWRRHRVIGEADGKVKYGEDADSLVSRESLWMEKRRQEALEDLGFLVVRWGWDDSFLHRARTRARILAAFARAARATA
jgi:hypothetical protein